MDGSSEGRGGSRSGSRSGGGGGGRRSSSNNGENSEKRRLSSLGTTLRRQGDAMAQKVVTLQKSDVGIVTVLRKVEAGLQALSTKDLFWKVRQHRGGGSPCAPVNIANLKNGDARTLSPEVGESLLVVHRMRGDTTSIVINPPI